MGDYVQAIRKIRVTTPLGDDALLLKSFSGTDEISRLFSFRLEMLAENRTKVPFDARIFDAFDFGNFARVSKITSYRSSLDEKSSFV